MADRLFELPVDINIDIDIVTLCVGNSSVKRCILSFSRVETAFSHDYLRFLSSLLRVSLLVRRVGVFRCSASPLQV
jgi:hypothetical protein